MPNSGAITPYWIRQIPRSLFLFDQIPLTGEIPPIPVTEVAEILKTTLGLSNLQFNIGTAVWTEEADFFTGIPNKKVFGLAIPGISGVFFLSAPANDLARLASSLLTGDEKNVKELDTSLEEGFTNFLLNEALFALQKSELSEKIQPVLLDMLPPLPKEAALVVKVDVTAGEIKIPVKLIFSKEFQSSLSSEFKPNLNDLYLKSPLSEKMDITVSFEAARFKMKLKEYKSVAPGDFLVVDNCSIDPVSKSGPLLLKVFGLPLFSGQLKDGKITLAEVAQYYEADANMQSEHPEKEEHEDFELEGEELDEFEEELQEFSEEELEELDQEKKSSKEEAEEEIEEFAEDLKKPEEKEISQGSESLKEQSSSPSLAEEKTTYEVPKTAKELFAAGEIPLSLSVEVGRVNISLKKLMELTSGNILEINSPKNSVDLVLNGKRVAMGELLKIGDVLGIRITDIGH